MSGHTVKNQFFGDKRDFFKWDLHSEVLGGLPGLRRFTFLPMLTPDDGSTDGQMTGYECGNRRRDLYDFLQKAVKEGRRDIGELRSFFPSASYFPYRDSEFFTHSGRSQYFTEIPEWTLEDALVFLDPDNGLEVASMKSGRGDRYVTLSEVTAVYRRLRGFSVLSVYQHFPRESRDTFVDRARRRLQESIGGAAPVCIHDNEIAFFFLANDPAAGPALTGLLRAYGQRVGAVVVAA